MALDPEIQAQQEALEAAIRQMTGLLGGMTGSFQRAANEINKVKVEEDYTKLSNSLKSNYISLSDATSELMRLDKAAAESGQALSAQATANREAIIANMRASMWTKTLSDSFQVVASVASGLLVTTLKEFASALTNGAGAAGYFNLGAKLMTADINALSNTMSGLGKVAESMSMVLSLTSKTWVGQLAAVAIDLVGAALDAGAKQLKDKAQFAVEILNQQVQQMILAFQTYSKAGGVFVNGLTDVRNIANEIGITTKDLAAYISTTSQQLVLFGGTVAGGAEKLGKVTDRFTKDLTSSGRTLRTELSNLGYSIEDQMSITADYLEMLARGGRLREKNDQEIARESYEYAKSLKVIASITGEESKQAQKRAKQALEQSYVQTKMAELGVGASNKFKLAVANMPGFEKGIQQFATEGFTTDPDLARLLEQIPALKTMFQQLSASIRDPSRSLSDFEDDLIKLRAVYGPMIQDQFKMYSEGVGFANLFGQGGPFAGMESYAQAAFKFATASAEGVKAQEGAIGTVEGAATTTDKLTGSIAAAETQFRKMAINLEDKLQPAILRFVEFVDAQISTSSKYIDKMLEALFGKVTEAAPRRDVNPGRRMAGQARFSQPGTRAFNEELVNAIEALSDPRLGASDRQAFESLINSLQTPTDRRLEQGTQTTPEAIEAPRPVSSLNDPVVVAMTQTNQKLEELIEQNRELIRLNTQTARALA